MTVKSRLTHLEQKRKRPAQPVFIWREGDELTSEQKSRIAAAEARGDQVTIFAWDNRPEADT